MALIWLEIGGILWTHWWKWLCNKIGGSKGRLGKGSQRGTSWCSPLA